MKFNRKTILILLASLLVVGSGYGLWRATRSTPTTPAGEAAKPKADEPGSTTHKPAAQSEQSSDFKNLRQSRKLVITSPTAGERLANHDTVSGTISGAASKLQVFIKGNQNGKIADYTVSIPSGSGSRNFSFEVTFERSPNSGEHGVLELYTTRNGQKDLVTDVEVVF